MKMTISLRPTAKRFFFCLRRHAPKYYDPGADDGYNMRGAPEKPNKIYK